MKRILAIILLILTLCACTESEITEPVKIKIMTENAVDFSNGISIPGVEVEVIVVPQGKLCDSVMSAEDKPNIICIADEADAEVLDSLLLDMRSVTVSEYDRAKMIIEGAEEVEYRHILKGDRLSILPHFKNKSENYTRAWFYRADIFEKEGLEIPKTMSELNFVCNALKKKYKESTPLVLKNGYYALDLIAPAWKEGASIGAYYDFEDEKWRFGLSEEWAGNFVSFWATMYKGALIPDDYLTITDKAVNELIAGNRAFIAVDYIWRLDSYNKNQDWRIMPSPRADIQGAQNKIAKREEPFGGYAVCDNGSRENTVAISVLNEIYKGVCDEQKTELTERQRKARIAKIYTEDSINPARYLNLETIAIANPAAGYESKLFEFLTGAAPMSEWAEFAEGIKDDAGVKKLLSECRRAYNKAKG